MAALLPLAPLVAEATSIPSLGWYNAIHRGELLLVAIVAVGAAAGSAARSTVASLGFARMCVVGGAIVFCVFATTAYTRAKDHIQEIEINQKASVSASVQAEVARVSHVAAGFAVAIGLISVVIEYREVQGS